MIQPFQALVLGPYTLVAFLGGRTAFSSSCVRTNKDVAVRGRSNFRFDFVLQTYFTGVARTIPENVDVANVLEVGSGLSKQEKS